MNVSANLSTPKGVLTFLGLIFLGLAGLNVLLKLFEAAAGRVPGVSSFAAWPRAAARI